MRCTSKAVLKKVGVISSVLFLCVLSIGCGKQKKDATKIVESWTLENKEDVVLTTTESAQPKKVGVAMPTRTSERWLDDGANMKAQLEILGYEVDLEYAEDNIDLQITQIQSMLMNGADCLVIASIDSTKLVTVLEEAKRRDVPVIAYDRLLMESDAASYYATFDNREIGRLIATYIEETMELQTASEEGISYTVEFFMGSPDDNNALVLYEGVMEVLGKYLENNTLVCKSGLISFEDTCILRWSEQKAEEICTNIIEEYYEEEPMDIICSAFDGYCYGIKRALLTAGYDESNWPIITGQDAEKAAVKNIIESYQSMTIYKDTRELAASCVNLVQAVLEGTEPEINDTTQYYNGKLTVPSYLCTPVIVDKSNYQQQLIESGYYTELQLTN